MDNNEVFKTVIEIDDDDAAGIELSAAIEYEADESDSIDGCTVLERSGGSGDDENTVFERSEGDGYASCVGGSGFSFEAEGIESESAETPLSNHLQPDMTLKDGRYKIIRVVGAGGFGVVYLAHDSKLNIEVAVKELYPASLVNRIPGEKKMIIYGKDNARQYAYLLDRFILEARSMAKFNSVSNIVNIFDCFQENNTAYIVMEYIKGRTLEQYVRDNGGRLSIEKATELMNHILDGLSAIHSKGIIHRDIKPKNIFITPDNELKIIDFGAARFSTTDEKVVTRYSKVLTPGFAPPEQYRKDSRQGPYTDIYAASAVYYYMITGRVPEISVDRVVNDTLKPLGEAAGNVPEYVDRAIGRALELNSDLRLQSAAELKSGLNGQTIIRYAAEEKKLRFRRRFMIIATAAIALCAAALGVAAYKINYGGVSIDKLVTEDTSISVSVPLAESSTVSNMQLSAWGNVAQEFEAFVSENADTRIKLELQYYSSSTYESDIADKQPTVYLSSGAADAPEMKKMNSLLNEETTILYDEYKDGILPSDSYIAAFDPTVLYINEKLLESMNINASEDSFSSVADILALRPAEDVKLLTINLTDEEYYRSIAGVENGSTYFTALEEFCMGNVMFYIGHASDSFVISDAMTGYYTIAPAPDVDGVRAVGYEWQIGSECGGNEINAAQLLLSFMTSEEMQDILFVQSGYMVPVNPAAYEKFIEFNPQLSFIDEDIDGLYFVQE